MGSKSSIVNVDPISNTITSQINAASLELINDDPTTLILIHILSLQILKMMMEQIV